VYCWAVAGSSMILWCLAQSSSKFGNSLLARRVSPPRTPPGRELAMWAISPTSRGLALFDDDHGLRAARGVAPASAHRVQSPPGPFGNTATLLALFLHVGSVDRPYDVSAATHASLARPPPRQGAPCYLVGSAKGSRAT
jgi:hypothetical protein